MTTKMIMSALMVLSGIAVATAQERELPGNYDAETLERKKDNERRFMEERKFDLSPEEHLHAIEVTGMKQAVEAFDRQQREAGADGPSAASGDGQWIAVGPTGTPPPHTGASSATTGNGRVSAIHFRGTGVFTYYAGASTGGLWRRSSLSSNWTDMSQTLPNLKVSSIAVRETNATYIVVGTGDQRESGAGIFVTTNTGLTWTAATFNTSSIPTQVPVIKIDPNNEDNMIAATNNGIYRSTNGGFHWVQLQEGNFRDLVTRNGTFQIQLAVRVSPGELWRSNDFGASWFLFTDNSDDADFPENFRRARIATCRTSVNTLAMIIGDNDIDSDWGLETVIYSTDFGNTWRNITGNLGDFNHGQMFHVNAIAIKPDNPNEVYVGVVGLFRTTNANVANPTWTQIDGGHADVTQLVFTEQTGDNLMWICNDGGLYRHTVGGNTVDFNGIGSTGLRVAQCRSVDAERTMVVTGKQDTGTSRTVNNGQSWVNIGGGDGAYVAISDPIGQDFFFSSGPIPGCCSSTFFQPFSGGPENIGLPETDVGLMWYDMIGDELYSMTCGLFCGATSQPLPVSPGQWTGHYALPCNHRALSGSYLDATLFSTCWDDAGLFVSRRVGGDYDEFPESIDIGLQTGAAEPWRVVASRERLGESWLCVLGNTSWPRILHTTDFWQTYEDISSTLSLVNRVTSLVVMPFTDGQEIIAATTIGVFRTQDGGGTWEPFNEGMPIVDAREIQLDYRTNGLVRLTVATYGRGVWQRTFSRTPLVYVDDRNFDTQDGTLRYPYRQLEDAINAVPAGGRVALHGDNYVDAPITITSPMILSAYETPAIIR